MKIKMRSLAAGPGFILQPGKTYNLGSDLANSFVAGGYAEESGDKPTRMPSQPDPGDMPDAAELDE